MMFSGEKIIDGHPNPAYVNWLEDRIKQLEAINSSLRKQLDAVKKYDNKRFRHDYDYVPYEEDRHET